MKSSTRYPAALLVALTWACASATEPAADLDAGGEGSSEVVLAFGEEKTLAGAVSLGFRDVLEDSRCPVDVTCVWEGNASVEVTLRVGTGPSSLLTLNTTLDPRAVERSGLRITLLEVLPQPEASGPPPKESYTIRLSVGPSG